MNWNSLLQSIVIGLASGSLIALIALGYTLVYGIVELINFAHGEIFMMGAFCTITVVSATGVTPESTWPAIVGVAVLAFFVASLFSAGLNFGIDR
ncbi:MAG: ABC transporter permease subunit, partial [Thermomicrobiales bacterium]